MEQKRRRSAWAPFVAGGVGALVGGAITCPLEVVKTRLQGTYNKEGLMKSTNRFGTRTFHSLLELYREGGVRSLYKGMVPHLIGSVPARSIYFGVFSFSKNQLERRVGFDSDSMLLNWFSGVCAGVVTITLTSPIWVVKTRLQLQVGDGRMQSNAVGTRYKNSLDCVLQILRHEGPRAFFAGMSASYIGISESSIQFMLYEKFKTMVRERKRARRKLETGEDAGRVAAKKMDIGVLETLAISSCAKLIASALTYPHEVIRTRLREEKAKEMYKGFFNCMRVVWKNEGLAGLYGGLMPHLLRVVPNAAIMFVTYEAVLSLFHEK